MLRRVAFWLAVLIGVGVQSANADLRFSLEDMDDAPHILVSGKFDFDDSLDEFVTLVSRLRQATNQTVLLVSFDSVGGNVSKAIELGRLIRSHRLITFQPRNSECVSACALAFFGGLFRFAEPGAIGVHRSSFRDTSSLSADDAVAAVQSMTAELMAYMIEMGVDPTLLQVALRYDSDDVRYLSKSEMGHYRVTLEPDQIPSSQPRVPPVASAPVEPQTAKIPPPVSPQVESALPIPEARTGRVRYPKGNVALKAGPDGSSANLKNLPNGTYLSILASIDRWYRVQAGQDIGFLHHTWVYVDQYEGGPYDQRHIQIKSFDNLADASSYVRSSRLPVRAYLATNGWFAVTLDATFEERAALTLARSLKQQGAIPSDSFVTYSNTYMRKVCCE